MIDNCLEITTTIVIIVSHLSGYLTLNPPTPPHPTPPPLFITLSRVLQNDANTYSGVLICMCTIMITVVLIINMYKIHEFFVLI